jgi:hypothetical protein
MGLANRLFDYIARKMAILISYLDKQRATQIGIALSGYLRQGFWAQL